MKEWHVEEGLNVSFASPEGRTTNNEWKLEDGKYWYVMRMFLTIELKIVWTFCPWGIKACIEYSLIKLSCKDFSNSNL